MENLYWPLFDLRIRSDRIELRPPTDDDLAILAELASKGIHDPATMPFLKPWTDAPSPALERGLLQWGWRHRARWDANDWTLGCAVVVDDVIVGVQDLMAVDFATHREANTASWLGSQYQGQGIGRAMREAILSFAFNGLGANTMHSGGFPDNEASLGVSRALGYKEVGHYWASPRGVETKVLRLALERSAWESRSHPQVEVTGLEGCLDYFLGPWTSI
jgi:RimJ/RimL family protein N-acetyltransferase